MAQCIQKKSLVSVNVFLRWCGDRCRRCFLPRRANKSTFGRLQKPRVQGNLFGLWLAQRRRPFDSFRPLCVPDIMCRLTCSRCLMYLQAKCEKPHFDAKPVVSRRRFGLLRNHTNLDVRGHGRRLEHYAASVSLYGKVFNPRSQSGENKQQCPIQNRFFTIANRATMETRKTPLEVSGWKSDIGYLASRPFL